MKILQLLPELQAGGVERGTLELGAYLTSQGHESLVVSNGGRLVDQLESEGSRHIRLPVHRKHPKSIVQVANVRRLLQSERPDILHIVAVQSAESLLAEMAGLKHNLAWTFNNSGTMRPPGNCRSVS